jgi:signal transduction histidine kinase/DNA-binding response OmpR family regulator/DNA-binding LacI/PurR family transcriptional regulator
MAKVQRAHLLTAKDGGREIGLPRENLTIAYLSSSPGGLHNFEKWLMWRGIAEAANEQGVNLVYVAGEQFASAPQSVLYELIGTHNVNGIILWNSFVSHCSTLQETQGFVDCFAPLPVVSMDLHLSGCLNLLVEDAQGVRALLTHLVEEHGYQRIGFVKQENSHLSHLRQEAFEALMSDYGLFKPELVFPLDALVGEGSEFVEACEAIVAPSDDLAVQVIDLLGQIGLKVPEDMVVTGFNDGLEARGSQPPLTTVRLPYRSLGRKAVEMLISRIRGQSGPQEVSLTPYLITRRSCGCLEPMAEQAAAGILQQEKNGLEDALRSARRFLPPVMARSMGTSIESFSNAWSNRFLGIMIEELERHLARPETHTTPSRSYLHDLSELLREAVTESSNVTRWHEALTAVRQYLLPYMPSTTRAFAEDLWQQARVLIGQVAVRAEVHRGWQGSRRTEILREIESDLLISLEYDELLDVLSRGLDRLKIKNFFLVLYENEFNPNGRAQLSLAYRNGERQLIQPDDQFFSVSRLLPDFWLDQTKPYSLILEALFLREDQIGYLVFNAPPPLDPSACDVFQALRIQISGALKGVRLRQKLQDARQQAEEANHLKSRFLSMVSHELRTPLNLIVGLSEMAMRQQDRSREESSEVVGGSKFLEQIYVSGQHLDRLIRDVLDLASSQVGQMSLICKPLDLVSVLTDVASMGEHLAQQKNLRFRMEVPSHLPKISGDKTRLRQILLNLMSNAIKFTAHGEVVLTAMQEDTEVLISVRDTGLGIAKEDLDRIFDEFHQSDRSITRGYGGIGLGLAITRRLVEMHGGRIWVSSSGEEGRGSTFSFTLPVLANCNPSEEDEPQEQINSRDGVVVILTVERDEDLKLQRHLEKNGFVVEVLSLQDAPDVMENLSTSPPGAVVLDLAPASEQGWEVMKRVKENAATQDIPVLFYSLIQEEDSGVVLEMDYLTKPVGTDALVKALKRHGLVKSTAGKQRTVLIVDDDAGIVDMHARLIRNELPGVNILTARNGNEGLHIMHHTTPDLVLLDLMMPELDGFGVLKAMQSDQALRGIPVIVLSGQDLDRQDMEKLNQGVAAVLGKGMFSTQEILNRISDVIARNKRLGSESQKLVQQALGFIHEHYKEPISRADIAGNLCINEQYLSRCFNKEIGIGPMVYLSRYRIQRAKRLLEIGNLSITQVAMEVGMSSQSYFSRVFQEETGVTPSAYQRGVRRVEV